MTANERFDDTISAWLQDAAPAQLPQRVLSATFEQTRRARQARIPRWRLALETRSRVRLAVAAAAAIALVVAGTLGVGLVLDQQNPQASPSPSPRMGPSVPPQPTVDLGIFEPIAGWIVYGNEAGIWGDNPDGNDVMLPVVAGEPLAWSRDGARLLLAREGNLFILHADGSETQLTPDSPDAGSATLTRDGSRVVFEATRNERRSVFAVDADGGTAELLGELPAASRNVSFSPDGGRLVYDTWGSGDSNHQVWVMDVDGSNRHLIVANDITLGAGHLRGLAWSPAGDRIALGLDGNIYSFTPDGSDFRLDVRTSGEVRPFWSPDGLRVETKGPRHPGRSVGPLPPPTPTPQPTAAPPIEAGVADLLNGFLQARLAGAGAEPFVANPDDIIFGDVPLLYETSAGAPYDRAEFEQVLGVAWPYELTGFKLRLFAGMTLVEQLVFVARGSDGPVLEYVSDGFGTAIAPTTEDGAPVARPYAAFGGEVSFDVAHPWVFHDDGAPIRLIPQGALPTTDGGERNNWGDIRISADPSPIGTSCQAQPAACDALAIAQGIRSNLLTESTEPEEFGSGPGGVYMEVAGRSVLGIAIASDQRMALYLYDAPPGSSMRILVIAVVAHASEFAHAGVGLGPIPYSIEFHGQGGNQ